MAWLDDILLRQCSNWRDRYIPFITTAPKVTRNSIATSLNSYGLKIAYSVTYRSLWWEGIWCPVALDDVETILFDLRIYLEVDTPRDAATVLVGRLKNDAAGLVGLDAKMLEAKIRECKISNTEDAKYRIEFDNNRFHIKINCNLVVHDALQCNGIIQPDDRIIFFSDRSEESFEEWIGVANISNMDNYLMKLNWFDS
jgi:hypothetical protein